MSCPVCFQPDGECYLTCPRQCPWAGDHEAEDRQSQPDAVPPDMSDIDIDYPETENY
jgi:hypothetical protein